MTKSKYSWLVTSIFFGIIVLVDFFALPTLAAFHSVGFSFGSPALIGLRTNLETEDSPWGMQFEFSNLILENNRSNGEVKTFRIDGQYCFGDWSEMAFFLFGGANRVDGFLNRYEDRVKTTLVEGGVGLRFPTISPLEVSGELGLATPTTGVAGLEFVGLIANISLNWRFD